MLVQSKFYFPPFFLWNLNTLKKCFMGILFPSILFIWGVSGPDGNARWQALSPVHYLLQLGLARVSAFLRSFAATNSSTVLSLLSTCQASALVSIREKISKTNLVYPWWNYLTGCQSQNGPGRTWLSWNNHSVPPLLSPLTAMLKKFVQNVGLST